MAAPARIFAHRGCTCSFNCIFKFTLLSVCVIVIAGLVTGVFKLRDLQDRLGWIPSNETLYAENILLREQVKTLKKEKVALEHKFQKLEEKLDLTTDEKNGHFIEAKICANSSWWSVISAMLFGFLFRPVVNLCCHLYLWRRRHHVGGAVVAFQD